MRVIITGGHLTPAIALAQYLIQKQHQVFFFGRQYSSLRFHTLSQESKEAKQIGINFYAVPDWKVDRSSFSYTLISSPQFIKALVVTNKLITQLKPNVVVVFGSSLSVPVGLCAKWRHLPLVLHEQTLVPGLASRFVGRFADLVALGFKSTQKYFPKAIYTGNLLRLEFFKNQPVPAWYHNSASLPLILIMGGNQGSLIINQHLQALYPVLSQRYYVVHQCGRGQGIPREAELNQTLSLLSPLTQTRIVVKSWLTASEIAYLMSRAACVISRSGANTTAEIIHTQTPAIIIPFAHSAYGEQDSQAQFLKAAGRSLILSETTLTSASLLSAIDRQVKLNSSTTPTVSRTSSNLDRLYRLLLDLSKT